MRVALSMWIAAAVVACVVPTTDSPVPGEDTAQEEIDVMLPVNETSLAAAYLYCVTDDRAASLDLLVQQLEYVDAPVEDPMATATKVLDNGYCDAVVDDIERAAPGIREDLIDYITKEGLAAAQPIGPQVEPEERASIFKRIWEKLKEVFETVIDWIAGGGNRGKHITIDTGGADINAPIIVVCIPTQPQVPTSPFDPRPPPPQP